MPGHRPDVQDGGAGVSMGAGPAMEARVWLKAPVLAAWIYIDMLPTDRNPKYFQSILIFNAPSPGSD